MNKHVYYINVHWGGNLVRFFILFLLSIFFCIQTVFAVQYQNVLNTSVSGEFHLSHKIARISFFKTLVTTSYIQKSGTTQLGRFFVKNNTIDGYKLTLMSEKKGVLSPTGVSESQLDGETPIPYNLTIVKEGEVGEGIDTDYEHNSNDLTADFVTIMQKAGDTVSSLTDAQFTIYVNVVDDTNIMEMSGTYTDTLTLIYEDL